MCPPRFPAAVATPGPVARPCSIHPVRPSGAARSSSSRFLSSCTFLSFFFCLRASQAVGLRILYAAGPAEDEKRADEQQTQISISDVHERTIRRIFPLILVSRRSLICLCVTPWSRWRRSAERWVDYSRPSSTT